MKKNQYSRLFQLTAKFLKYFLLGLFWFTIAYLLSVSFGALDIFTVLLPIARYCFSKLGIILLCLMTTTIILESLR
ncbi:hypothetical protein [Calothrix sp. PCC 7507]|uniref:hypothetical protein n=1 Tax=Calothrix sp. PCC 7507 TaxID=99598 RepID=UPI00029EC53A|nr:hypothetical protein [Calothrix sp. PCC 7507]AFY35130.1 hypothetical protein Cal7507_4775 [Calothrix sp. PCC 7507]